MAIQKKHIIVGGIALVSITAAVLYWQFMKLKKSAIKLGGVRFKSLTGQALNFDLILIFTNISKLKIEIISQEYKVYLNDKFITTVSNPSSQVINSFTTSPITVNINIYIKSVISALKEGYKDILLNPANVLLRVDATIKVKLFGMTFNIPYVYNTNLKELTTKKPE